jgi:UDP-glucose 4-epimerase
MKSKCLVTGGNGFIGSHLVDRLIKDNHEVLVVDNLISNAHEKFFYNPLAIYLEKDIINIQHHHLKDVDYVFHLAAESRIPACLDNPTLAVTTNVHGTCRLLELAKNSGVKRFLFSSTSSVYGNDNPIPAIEYFKKDCLNPYSITKSTGEDFCKMYFDLYGLETIIFRYFNVYGERQPTKGQYAPVVGLFQKQHAEGKPMTVVGDGKQTRDYIHVSDVVEANILAMDANNCGGEVFNIGCTKRYSVLDLAQMVGGEDADIKFLPPRDGEARHTSACTLKAKESLNWEPKVNLNNWIKESK